MEYFIVPLIIVIVSRILLKASKKEYKTFISTVYTILISLCISFLCGLIFSKSNNFENALWLLGYNFAGIALLSPLVCYIFAGLDKNKIKQ
jgi:membrane-bound metal-dependent hydrolase YbcI (DUF457 family)